METLKKKAQKANAMSRMCKNCKFRKLPLCNPTVIDICSNAYIEGFMKGYKKADKITGMGSNFVENKEIIHIF